MSVIISTDRTPVTVISAFTVEPGRQDELVALLRTNADTWLRQLPGFLAAAIHVSSDGTRVLNYAQWESEAAIQAMRTDPNFGAHTAAVAALASVAPNRYSVAAVISGAMNEVG